MTRLPAYAAAFTILTAFIRLGYAQDASVLLKGKVVRGPKLDAKSYFEAEGVMAKVLHDQRDSILTCYGATESPKDWDTAIALGQKLRDRIDAFTQLTDPPKTVVDARAGSDRAQTELKNATDADAIATQKLSEPNQTKDELDAATKAKLAADLRLGVASDAASKAQAAQTSAETAERDTRRDSTLPVRDQFAKALAQVENASRSPANFREAVRSKERRNKCKIYTDAVNAAFDEKPTSDKAQQDEARLKARVDDTIDKTTGVASAVASASNALEQPGAPERIVYTIMSALGADSKTTGSQLLMTLNLASVGSSDTTKPVESPFLRNLFLRAALPLMKTDGQTQAVAASTSTSATGPAVSRISFVLGGSLVDDSDPRLTTYDECFEFVKAYIPLALDVEESRARVDERQLYYGSCAQIAANSERLAWRAGLGLSTATLNDHQKTKTEVLAAALVYGPTDAVLFNLIGQRWLEPYVVNTMGAGVSLRIDAGGQKPGGQWGRVSIDALGLAEIREADRRAGIMHSTGWEARISLSAAGKVATGGIAQFSIGPRILGSGNVGLFSTLALSYDADHLIDTLLVPPPTPAPTPPTP